MPPKPNPTVSYDSSPDTNDLLPPDLDELESRRPWYHRVFHHSLPRNVQLPLSCFSIAISAVQANGVYCWPTYGPVVAKMLELDGAQAQTIVVGGILGVYLMAAPLGAFTDRHGPRAGSLVSGILAAAGYLIFALLLSKATPTTPYIHLWLTAAYFCVGSATVGTYFACLTCASLSFPGFPTLSLSLPLSLVGLSSLFLSSFSTLPIFTSTQTADLDPIKFLTFLGILCPLINLFSALFMRIIPPPAPRIRLDNASDDDSDDDEYDAEAEMRMSLSQSLHLDERTPLLLGGIPAAYEEVEEMERGKDIRWTVVRLIKDWEGFWAFGLILALCIGPSETIIASIGSILTSVLPPPSSTVQLLTAQSALGLRNKHVQILSLTSTVSRLITGVLADYLCPPTIAIPAPRQPGSDPEEAPTHLFVRKRPIRVYRSILAASCSIILAGVYAWSAGALTTERGLWVLSGGVGTFYGALFTLTPAIVSAHFGPTNFGLAWGMVSYFAALGSVLFSYLYALLSVAAADKIPSALKTTQPVVTCYGPECFSTSLWVATGCAILASLGFAIIGRRWKV